MNKDTEFAKSITDISRDVAARMSTTVSDNTDQFDANKLPLAVKAHYPGQTFTFSDGTEYEVQYNGSWKKVINGLKGKARRKAEGK